MKKLTSLILCSALALLLAGCGSGTAETPTATTSATTEATTTTAAPDNSGDEFVSEYKAFTVTTKSLTEKGFWEEITANTVNGNLSPDLSWEPVEGATCYAIYMIDMNTHYVIHWAQGDITETNLPQGFAGTKYYAGMSPAPGDTHVYNTYVFALKNPVEKVKGSVRGINPKTPEFIKALDTDKDGNTGNIIAVGKVSGKYTRK